VKVYSDPFTREFSDKKLPFYLRRSFFVHIALFSLTLIGGKVISVQQEKLREANMELVQASVRVDMVAMPKYTLAELKNLSSGVEAAKKEEPAPIQEVKKEEPKEAEPVKEVKPEEPKVAEKDSTQAFEEANQKKKMDFLSKLKQIGNKKIKSEGTVKADKGAYGEKSTALKDLILSGNKLSKGVAIYGSGNAAEMTAFQAYAGRLPDYVRPHWSLPSFLIGKNLKCRVRVWLSADGNVTRAEVYQSSGETDEAKAYDQRALEAVRNSKFPPLTEEISKRALAGNIVLGFPL
jgi:colicin import membrane protein